MVWCGSSRLSPKGRLHGLLHADLARSHSKLNLQPRGCNRAKVPHFSMPSFGNHARILVLVRPPLQRVGAQQESVHSRFLTARIITPIPLVRPGCDTMICIARFTFFVLIKLSDQSIVCCMNSSLQASSDAAQSFNSFCYHSK